MAAAASVAKSVLVLVPVWMKQPMHSINKSCLHRIRKGRKHDPICDALGAGRSTPVRGFRRSKH